MKRSFQFLVVCAGLALLLAGYVYHRAGLYGFNVLLTRGPVYWTTVTSTDPRLTPGMRLALGEAPVQAVPGAFAWRDIEAGFAVGELPVLANGVEISRIHLARVDPARFRFVVRTAPAGHKQVGDWLDELGAVLAINGSYYAPQGMPSTPIVSAGWTLGPAEYAAKHGAFVASATHTAVRDLTELDWRQVLAGAADAMVSYPLLLAPTGAVRVEHDTRWLADRSFIAQDRQGRIVLGTTTEGFFSLHRLAGFLRAALLDLKIALNLDGGPVACQAIAIADYRRHVCGRWELAAHGGELKLLQWPRPDKQWGLPIVLAVLRR
jgi:hypothetical protein